MVSSKGSEEKKSIASREKEYFVSGAWKCPQSTTGSHIWNCNFNPPVCKVCGKVKLPAP